MVSYDGGATWSNLGSEISFVGGSGSSYNGWDALSLMMAFTGMSADHADAAAQLMRLEASGFSIASRGFGAFGIISNGYEMWQDGEWNWTDGGQVLLGGALMIPGLNVGVLITGGITLTAWELYELHNQTGQ